MHPLTKVHWELLPIRRISYPTHCIVHHGKPAILCTDDVICDKLIVLSVDHRSATYHIRLPHRAMSLTTYKSKLVAIGGYDPSTKEPTNLVFSSDTGLEWQPSLPRMITKRYQASAISSTSPDVIVVAGGIGLDGIVLDEVELLVEDEWCSANRLPKPCYGMSSTLHENDVVLADRHHIYSCSIASLISSCTESIDIPLWRVFYSNGFCTTIFSYSSRLYKTDGKSSLSGYCTMSQSWADFTEYQLFLEGSYDVAAAVLPTGDVLVASKNGTYKLKVSGECIYFTV